MTNINKLGTLYIVPTPIGNLQDMSLRAIETLKLVDAIAAEDTRHSAPLLRHYNVSTPVLALHEHNERERATQLLAKLQKGESIALISDAGTPLINDPGYFLVREARAMGVKIVPIPGACALIAALCASGLPTDRFVYEGFLPAKNKARLDRLLALSQETRTMIFYEAPHRILDLVSNLREVFGDARTMVLARELTKTFETIQSGTLAEMYDWISQDPNQQKGEMVVLLQGSEEVVSAEDASSQRVLEILLEELPMKQAVDLAVKITGAKKNGLYELALRLKR